MTDEERQLIQGLADRIRNAPAPQPDRDADNLIRQSIGSRQDALYILTQTVLIQEMALSQAKAQIEQLKNQTPPQPPASFLPSNNPAPQPSGRSYGGGGYQGSNYQGSGYQAPQPPPVPQYQYEVEPQPQQGRFSSFLHNAAQTAAGVVAGEVAFSALSSIFGHHGGGGGGFFGGGGGYYGSPISPGSETIINNYYEGDQGGARSDITGDNSGGFGNDRDLQSAGLSPDIEDRRFAGDASGDSNDQQDDNTPDDSSDDNTTDDNSDDSSSDDGSSYDDGSDSNDV